MQVFVAAVYSSPVIGDLDGDGKLEVVIGCMDHNVYALKPTPSGKEIKWQGLAGEGFNRTKALSYLLDYRPDFAISSQDIIISEGIDGNTFIHANITNLSASYDGNIKVRFYDEFKSSSTQIGTDQIITSLSKMEIETISVKWTPALFHNISVIIDPDNLIDETNKDNNIAKKGTGGNTPTITNVWSDYGNWTDLNTVGTFLVPIQFNNIFIVLNILVQLKK